MVETLGLQMMDAVIYTAEAFWLECAYLLALNGLLSLGMVSMVTCLR